MRSLISEDEIVVSGSSAYKFAFENCKHDSKSLDNRHREDGDSELGLVHKWNFIMFGNTQRGISLSKTL